MVGSEPRKQGTFRLSFAFQTPTPWCFSYECERKGVAGKGCWNLLKIKGRHGMRGLGVRESRLSAWPRGE
jgi:hypothetical protein